MSLLHKMFAALALSVAAWMPAHAGLVGDTVTVNYDFPNVGTVFFPGGTQVIAPGGTTFPLAGGLLPVTVSDTTIVITFVNGITFSNDPSKSFDGLVINDALPDITSATLASTNIPGFTTADVTFDSNNIEVNFPISFASLDPGATITLDIGTAAVVPEPDELALLALGLVLVVYRRRRPA
jgi:hypothetical protein